MERFLFLSTICPSMDDVFKINGTHDSLISNSMGMIITMCQNSTSGIQCANKTDIEKFVRRV